MEYRLRYRDLPWSVALAALPGKIIGGYLIRPTEAIADDPMHYVAKFAKFLLSDLQNDLYPCEISE